MPDLERLNKKELQEEVRLLRKQVAEMAGAINHCKSCNVLHALQVLELKLEVQNIELSDSQLLLEETRDNYADLYDFSPVSYISFDDKGIITNINLTATIMLGEVRSNLINRPFIQWLDKSSVGLFYKHISNTLASTIKVVDELVVKSVNGEIINVCIESVPSILSSNDSFRCRSVIIDITESTRIKNEILLQARQLKLITDSLPVLISYLDLKEHHQFSNKTYDDSFNFSPEIILGLSAKEVWGTKIYNDVKKQLKLALSGEYMVFDMELPIQNEQKKYFTATLIPDLDNDAQVHGVIVLIGDITDRVAIEVINRKRLLYVAHYSRLSTIGEMASEIAHELNQPLAAISIYSDACLRLITSGKAEVDQIIDPLSKISEQAVRAGVVIRKIREFVSKKDLDKVKINLNDIVEDALQLLEVEIQSYNIKLDVSLSGDTLDILVDKILIEQVIFNLIRNSLEAMDGIKNERMLSISTSMGKFNEVLFTVDDSGPGLPIEKEKNIFNAFQTTKKNGMGMGLAISHSIILAHHGQLKTLSSQYGGACFCFILPLV